MKLLKMRFQLLFTISLVYNYCGFIDGISINYITELCVATIGPAYGEVVAVDTTIRTVNGQKQYLEITEDLDCWLTIRGIANVVGQPQRYIGLIWRNSFHEIRGYDSTGTSTECDTAYLEVYEEGTDGTIAELPTIGPICGTDSPPNLVSIGEFFVIHLHAQANPNAVIVETPNITVTTTPQPGVTDAVTDTVNNTNTGNNTEVVTEQPFLGPWLDFRAEFTSYFEGNCTQDGVANDDQQLQCLTGRCVHISLQCDNWGSNNCGTSGDQADGAPGFCSTTTEATITTDSTPELLLLWIILGLLLFPILLYWCCWKPGWFIWRICRLRQCWCCRLDCCQRCCGALCGTCGCCGGTLGGCCLRCGHCCTSTGSGYPDKARSDREPDLVNNDQDQKGKPFCMCCPCCQGVKGDPYDDVMEDEIIVVGSESWLNFAAVGGAHVRENR